MSSWSAPPVSRWPDDYAQPAVKLARMAVDRQLQGQGVGQHLIRTAIALVQNHVATRIGCRLLVTDAKQGAVGFYERMGFTILDTETNRSSAQPVMFRLLNRD
jgi:ribosomal protein S18 acetylase RimI-like enzyme